MERQELLNSPEYWIVQMQIALQEVMREYMVDTINPYHKLKEKSGISIATIRDIYDGECKGTVEEYVKILVAIGKCPVISIEDIKDQK